MSEMPGLYRLADVPEYEPPGGVRVAGGKIVCSVCGAPATTLHLVSDGGISSYRLKASCENLKHDRGGYWLVIEELVNQFETWLPHLAEKKGNMLHALIQGLGKEGLSAILQIREASK